MRTNKNKATGLTSYNPDVISLANLREPATLQRSPMLTKLVYGPILNASKPEKKHYCWCLSIKKGLQQCITMYTLIKCSLAKYVGFSIGLGLSIFISVV